MNAAAIHTSPSIHPQDLLFIKALKEGRHDMINRFFNVELAPLLGEIRAEVFRHRIETAELVSELYILLSADGWRRLDSFSGERGCRLRTWMSQVAWRFFLSARARILGCRDCETDFDAEIHSDRVNDDLRIQIAIDVNAVLARMPNRRYAEIIRLLVIEGYSPADTAAMLDTTTDNIYNLKHRAISQFLKLYGSK